MNETILTLAELKQYLGIAAEDESHDEELAALLNVLPEYLHDQTGVWFGEAKEVTETHDYERVVFLDSIPVISVSEIKRGYGDNAVVADMNNIRINKSTGRLTLGYNYGYISNRRDYDEVEVTYTSGIVVVPATIKEAAKIFASNLFNAHSNDGLIVSSEQIGTLRRTYKVSTGEQSLLSGWRVTNA